MLLGNSDGETLGPAEGVVDGTRDGLVLGDADGFLLGDSVGFVDGIIVVEGTLVGAGVFAFVSGSPWVNDFASIVAFANTF